MRPNSPGARAGRGDCMDSYGGGVAHGLFLSPGRAAIVLPKGTEWAGRPPVLPVAAISAYDGQGGRKVRAPQDTAMGNAHRPRGQGKCNRK